MIKRAVAIACMLLLFAACGKRFPPTELTIGVPEPHADSIDSVVFMIGDAGQGTWETSPILHRLYSEVEQWSRSLRDSSVLVLFLGDNVYPGGIREGTPEFAQDSAHLEGQLNTVAGEQARAHKTRAVFIAGNHDWGHKPGLEGQQRLANMQRLIERRAQAGGYRAFLLPRSGDPGPAVVHVGRKIKLLLIDTAWWLLEADYQQKLSFLQKLDKEVATLGERELVIAAHHPWQSGSAHGGLVPFWSSIGVRWLLARSGAMLQDINSLPYRDLKNQFSAVFRKYRPPLLFAGGHDHNLQVIRATLPDEPLYNIVSGAGSKSSEVGPTDGSLFFRDEPGYMRLVTLRNGSVDLFVVSASEDFKLCESSDDALRQQCLVEGARSFRTVFSRRLQ